MTGRTPNDPSRTDERAPGFVLRNFRWDDETPVSELVVECIADATDRDPDGLTPLADSIDPDALDAIFAPDDSGAERGEGVVELEHENCHVMVHDEGRLAVRELTHRNSR